VWVLYLPLILAPVLFNRVRDVIVVSAMCSALTISDMLVSPLGHNPLWTVVLNRAMGLTAIWLMTIAGIMIVKRSRQVTETMNQLRAAVAGQEQAQQALSSSEARLRLAAAGAGMGTWDVDLRSGDAIWSETQFRMLGYEPAPEGEASWDMWLSRIHPDDLERVLVGHDQAWRKRAQFGLEFRIRRAASTEIAWLAVFGRYEYDPSGEMTRFRGVSFDITKRKELEHEALEIVAREQQRIGQELHDSVGQELTGLGLIANSIAQRFQESDPANRVARRLTAGIERVQQQVRDLSHGLVPFQVEASGLRGALKDLAVRAGEQSGIHFSFRSPESVEELDQTTARQLFRIAQEAVNNAIRHGQPQNVHMVLDWHTEGLQLRVEDDGAGMPAGTGIGDGMGLRIMEYRAGLVGGVIRIEPRAGGGTRVTCSVPRRYEDVEERGGDGDDADGDAGAGDRLHQSVDCG
jgi:signal transduction histidine kinase